MGQQIVAVQSAGGSSTSRGCNKSRRQWAAASAVRRASRSVNSSSIPSAIKSGWSFDQGIVVASFEHHMTPDEPGDPLPLLVRQSPPLANRVRSGRIDVSAQGDGERKRETGLRRQPRQLFDHLLRRPRSGLVAGAISGRTSAANPLSNNSFTPAARPGSASIRRISMAIRSGLTT